MKTEPYQLHRTAIRPILENALPAPDFIESQVNFEDFAAFLNLQGLHGLWLDLLHRKGRMNGFDQLTSLLRANTVLTAATDLAQARVLDKTHDLFSTHHIPYFVAKGVHLRQVHYAKPSMRPAVDIDVFVRAENAARALQLLRQSGFKEHPDQATLSHELKLTHQGASVDLHWNLFRPGRARKEYTEWLFEHRSPFGKYEGLDPTASLLVMLVHPPITKYLVSPTSKLIHQVDQARIILAGKYDHEELVKMIKGGGLSSAAWSALYFLRQVSGFEARELEEELAPSALKRRYLKAWIDHAWIERWFDKRWLVAGFFNLALQDTLADAWRASRMLRTASTSIPLDSCSAN